MSNKRPRKKLQRAVPTLYPPGGGLMYVPAGQAQGLQGQTFYGNKLNIPVGQTSLFSPGVPLPPQPDVDPQGKPVQFRFPVSYNSFPVDRSLGRPDIPSFEQLRRLAKMYSGITLNERYWADLVPRMTLDIKIKKEYVDQGAETKNYQKQIGFFRNFWEKPDGRHDMHTWLRMALREQTQIDELYLYKNRTRGRKLLGLWVVAGDQIKPLLDDWGMEPAAPDYAYQQYPWGIPGMMYSTAQMVHYQESPAADTPYGFSRVERVILEVNQALRKKRKDLANFTEGNIPQSFMEVPESLNWTPDQIDSYEQSWNALVAGQAQQQIRMKFLQPGMKYIPAEQYQMLTDFDLFILKTTCGVYGVPVTEFGFTEDSNRSSGESQEDMVYRRTIGPNASTYGRILTQSMDEDFPPEMQGEMFEAVFGGYEEVEDEQKKASAITTYTNAGILGLTDAAKMANLPIDPESVSIGRIRMTATGPIFLDDVAQPDMRKAQAQATMAGYQLAANPPAPTAQLGTPGAEDEQNGGNKPPATGKAGANTGQKPGNNAALSRIADAMADIDEQLSVLRARNVTPEEDDFESWPQPNTEDKTRRAGSMGREDSSHVARGTREDTEATGTAGRDNKEISAEYRRWRTRAVEDIKAGRQQRTFESALIPENEQAAIRIGLECCDNADMVRAMFDKVRQWPKPIERDTSPKVPASVSGGNQQPTRSSWKLRW